MQLLDDYLTVRKQIVEYFGYGHLFPQDKLLDYRDRFWFVTGEYSNNHLVESFYPMTANFEDCRGCTYDLHRSGSNSVKAVYRKSDFTLVIIPEVETLSGRSLILLNNVKECKDSEIKTQIKSRYLGYFKYSDN